MANRRYCTPTMVQDELHTTTGFTKDTTPSDDAVNRWIEEETRNVELKTGTVFSSTIETSMYLDYNGVEILPLPHKPVLAITMFKYNSNDVTSAASWKNLEEGFGKNYLLYSDEGEIEFINGNYATNQVNPVDGHKKFCITYSHGYSTIPLEIQRLCTLLVAKRVILSLVQSQANSEGGEVQVGVIRVSDPSQYSINTMRSLNDEIDRLYGMIGQEVKTYVITRNYD